VEGTKDLSDLGNASDGQAVIFNKWLNRAHSLACTQLYRQDSSHGGALSLVSHDRVVDVVSHGGVLWECGNPGK